MVRHYVLSSSSSWIESRREINLKIFRKVYERNLPSFLISFLIFPSSIRLLLRIWRFGGLHNKQNEEQNGPSGKLGKNVGSGKVWIEGNEYEIGLNNVPCAFWSCFGKRRKGIHSFPHVTIYAMWKTGCGHSVQRAVFVSRIIHLRDFSPKFSRETQLKLSNWP